MCDRPWSEVWAEAKAAGTKPSSAEVLAHAAELSEVFEHWHDEDDAERLAMAENPRTTLMPEAFDDLMAWLDEPDSPAPALLRAAERIEQAQTVRAFISTGRYDWFTTSKGRRLHWAEVGSVLTRR